MMLAFWIGATEGSLTGPLIGTVEGQLEENSWPVWVSDGFDSYGEALKQSYSSLETYP